MARQLGRSPCALNSPNEGGGSACWRAQESRPTSKPVSRCSRKSYVSWVGSTAAMCGSKSDLLALIPRRLADAEELVALQPDVIMATGVLALQTLLQTTRSVPIVFNSIGADPVGSGYVDTLARPGVDATGFVLLDYALTAKWMELLKEIAPTVTRVAVLRDPELSSGVGQFAVIQYVAPSVGMEVSAISIRDAREIEKDIAKFASAPNGGLILTASALSVVHRDLIVGLAAKYKLPAVYHRRYFVAGGGLMSYGPEVDEGFRGAARYVDRILKGEKPAGLPVQAPTKYELVINRKTAQALGLTVPPSLLARADEVIE